jgi:hypothetical protein
MLSLKGIGGSGSDQIGRDITKTQDGKFILRYEVSSLPNTGNIDSFCSVVQKRLIFVEYNEDGTPTEWSKCYGFHGDSFLTHIFPKPDKSVVLGGLFNSTAGWGWLITKQDDAGNTIWQRNYSKGGGSILRSMIATNDGGYILLGESHRTDTNVLVHYGSWSTFDIWVLKLDSNGYKQWSKVIGGSYDEAAFNIVPAPSDGYYIIGATQSSDYDCTGYHAGGQDGYVARLDANGNILWHRCLGGSGYEAGYPVGYGTTDGKGGLLVTMSTTSTDGDVHNHIHKADYWVVNIDSAGNITWENCYDAGDTEYPSSICKATDGSIWITGWTYKNYYEDVFLVHTDSIGSLLQTKVMGSNDKDQSVIVYPLQGGTVLTGGYYYANNNGFSSLVNYGYIDVFLAVFAPWSVGIDNKQNDELSLKIYPNPVKGTLYVEKLNNNTNTKISLMSIDGKQMIQTILASGNSRAEIDVAQYPKGIYWVRISSDSQISKSHKITIE